MSIPNAGLVTVDAISASACFASQPERVSSARDAVAIIGCGNSARALAAYLSARGHSVRLLVRSPEKAATIHQQGHVRASGKIEGEFPVDVVTADPSIGVLEAETIFVATVTTAYEEIARTLAPHLRANQQVILFSSKFGGVVHFAKVLRECGVDNPNVMETDALFACRTQDDGSIWIRGFKEWTLFSAENRSQTAKQKDAILKFFPQLQIADNVVQRGLTDFGALTHALTMLVNMNVIDRGQSFPFYLDGFTERTVALLERMEQEFRAVAEAYGTTLIPMAELLNRYYGCDTSSLLSAMRSVPNYRLSQSPQVLHHRYIEEDVSCSLVPISQLARKAAIETPLIDAVVTLASTVLNVNFSSTGRTLEKLGWASLTSTEIRQAINA
jgi:opine dehydrogenase